jgi:hypothetical protein
MEQNNKELIERVLLMMKYDSSKTLNENKSSLIVEQPDPPKFTETTKKNILRCKSEPRDYSWLLKNNKSRLKSEEDVDSFCKNLEVMFNSQYIEAEESTPEGLEQKEKTEKILSNVTILDKSRFYLVLGDTNTSNSTNNGEVNFVTYKKYQDMSDKNWRNLIMRTVELSVYYRGKDKYNLLVPKLIKTYKGSTIPGQKMGTPLKDKKRTWNQTGVVFGQKIDLSQPGYYVIVATTNENKKFGQKIINFEGFSDEEYKQQSGESIEKNSDILKKQIFDENNDVKNGVSTQDLLKYIDLKHDEGSEFENDLSFQRALEYLMNRISSMNYSDLLNLQKFRSNKVGTITSDLPGFNNGLPPTLTSILIENQIYQYRKQEDPFAEMPHYELADKISKEYVSQNFITLSNKKENGRAKSQEDSDFFRKWFILNFPEKSKNPCGENKPLGDKGIYNQREIICAYQWKPLSKSYLTDNEKKLGLGEKTAFELYELIKNNKNLRLQIWDPSMYNAVTTKVPMKESKQIKMLNNSLTEIKKINKIIDYLLNEQVTDKEKEDILKFVQDTQNKSKEQKTLQGVSNNLASVGGVKSSTQKKDPGKELYDKVGVKFVEIPIDKHDLIGKIYNRTETPKIEMLFPNQLNNNQERIKNSNRPFNEPKYVYDEPSPSVQENLRYCLDYFTSADHQILEMCGITKQTLKNMFQTNRCDGIEEFLIKKLSDSVKSKKINPEDFLYLINKQRNYKGYGTLGGTFMKGNPIGSQEYKVNTDYTTEYPNKPIKQDSEQFKKILEVLQDNKRILSIWSKKEYRCLVGLDGKDSCGGVEYCGTGAKFYFIEVANGTKVLTKDEIDEWEGTKEGVEFKKFCSTQKNECNLIIGNYLTKNVTGEKILIKPKDKFDIPCSSDFMEEWSGFIMVGSLVLSFLLPGLLAELGPFITSLFNSTTTLRVGTLAGETAIATDNWRKLGQIINLVQNVLVGGVFTYESYKQKDKVGTYLGLIFTVLPILMEVGLVKNYLIKNATGKLEQTENAIKGLQSKVSDFINSNPNFTRADYNSFVKTLTIADQKIIEDVIELMKMEPRVQQFVFDNVKQNLLAAYLKKFSKINNYVHVGLFAGVFGYNYIRGYQESDFYKQKLNLLNSQRITPQQANLLDVLYYNMDNQEKLIFDALIKGDSKLLEKVLKNSNAQSIQKVGNLLGTGEITESNLKKAEEIIISTTDKWIKETLESEYNLFKENNPDSEIDFESWKNSLASGIYDDYLGFIKNNKGVTFGEYINDNDDSLITQFNSYVSSNPNSKLDYKKWKNAKNNRTLEKYDIYLKTAATKISYDEWLKQTNTSLPNNEDPNRKKNK